MAQGYPPEEDAQDNAKLAIHSFSGLLRPGATLSHRVQPVAHPMQMGLDGTSGRLDGAEAGKSYWIKVPDNEQRRLIVTSSGALMATAAGKAGIAPALVMSDEQTGGLLFDDLGEEEKFAIVADFRKADTKAAGMECVPCFNDCYVTNYMVNAAKDLKIVD